MGVGNLHVSSKGVLEQSALLSGVFIVDFPTQALLSRITVSAHNSFSKGTVPILLRGMSGLFQLSGYSRHRSS